ncbi:MAG: hypothetical protein M3Q19_06745 [Pseudomonadota bacterium]|nr:hypothetical protein [Pseudomonadota bacterium]
MTAMGRNKPLLEIGGSQWISPVLEVRLLDKARLVGAVLEEANAENAAVILAKEHPCKRVVALFTDPLNGEDPPLIKATVPRHFWRHSGVGIGLLDGL